MVLPEPPVALAGGCTVIFNNTLYSYSSAGLQSLALNEGAEWKKLTSGHSVDGAVCVGSTPNDPSAAGLFIVGGKSSQADYPGLQKFTYSTGKWKTITPQVTVTKDRVYHSATYLNSTESILVYAGSTDGAPNLSQQTFTIGTSEPYGVLAFQAEISPPGVAPLMLPWSETQAAMLGGNAWNTQILLFDTTVEVNGVRGSWIDSGITLAEPLPKNTTAVKAAIIQADDGSKHLYTFDLTTLPNTVNRTVLIDANGAPMVASAPVKPAITNTDGQGDGAASVQNRDLFANNWPSYNSTFAPKSARTDYSIATDSNGLVVMSGGNDVDVLCMFNAKANTWEDATAVLGAQSLSIQSTPTAASTSTSGSSLKNSATNSATSTALASPTPTLAALLPSSKSALPPTTILGIALGSIIGVALLLVIILLLLRRRQRRKSFVDVGHARRASGIPEKNLFHGDSAQASGGYFKSHNQQGSQSSFSSMAMFLGKSQKSAFPRKGSNEMRRISSSSMHTKDIKHTISRPQPQSNIQPAFLAQTEKAVMPPEPSQPKPRSRPLANPDTTLRRSSGWNRYWSGGSTSIMGFGSDSKSRPDTEISDESSRYSDVRRTQDSAIVPPLQVPADGRPSFHYVNSGSPTVSQYGSRIGEGLSGQIERPVSAVSAMSSSGYSSGIPPSVHEAWDPTMPKKPWGSDRAPSSAYSNSTVDESLYPTGLGVSTANRPPVGMSRQPQLAVASVSTDMSWLNLGDNDRSTSNGRSFS
ncbi:putative pre-mRNA splicing factor clf1 [Rosellinia necatrix]|uniref:Putative pre-mRNA splicing factor clf1 n=1 Tax=Rosellinia necatrix TaxID=77044 RepID=A0A1W2TD70_ROSNE|nr:putative pre-mRNA splicing factor clf1 [Rosellinia necatrix]